MILSSKGNPFKTKAGAISTIRIKNLVGHIPVEVDGGWGIQEEDYPVLEALGSSYFEPSGLLKQLLKRDVKCPGCRQSFHETTDKYTPDTVANPSMLTLKSKYIEWGWENVPMDATAGFGCLECPECGYPLAPEGKLLV